jgi:hypothetical protein
MRRSVLKAVALSSFAVANVAVAQVEYTDTQTYQVQSKYPATTYAAGYQLDNRYPWETQVVAFNPVTTYSTSQQTTVVSSETSLTAPATSVDPADGMQLMSYNQGSIPEASQPSFPAPIEYLPQSTSGSVNVASAPYTRSYFRDERLGNSLFGTGYTINASITATPPTATAAKRIEALGEGKVYGLAFGFQREIVRGRAYISGQSGGGSTGTAAVFVMGQQIWSVNLVRTFNTTPLNWSRTFFNASKTFMVGPIPITVKASLSGGAKVTITGEIGPVIGRLEANPGGWANVAASASVNVIVARFGVQGSLNLINVSLPSVGELYWPLCSLDWVLTSTLNLSALAGNIDLFAELRFLFFKKKWTVNIARWGGINRSWTLLNINGTHDLGLCSGMAAAPVLASSEM